MGNYSEALNDYQEAMKYGNNKRMIYLNMLKVYEKQQKNEKIAKTSEIIGDMFMESRDYGPAIRYWRKAMQIVKSDVKKRKKLRAKVKKAKALNQK